MRTSRLGFLQKIIIIVLVVILITSLGISIWISGIMTQQMASAVQFTKPVAADKPHIFILLSDIDSSFRDTFLIGAIKAANDYGAELEIDKNASTGGAESYASAMEAAVDAHVDGIILQPAWRESLTDSVKRATDKRIPFITIEEDIPSSGRTCNVGFNSFEFGNLAARMAGAATNNQASIAVVYRGLNQENGMESSLKIAGIRDIVSLYGGMKLVRVEQGTNAFFGAEETMRDILTSNPEVNVLICMTARDTIAAAQTVLDLNRLQDIQIIGTDMTPEIQDLLDKKILYGTISRNPESIGYRSVEAMVQFIEGKTVTDFIDVGLDVIDN